MRRRGADSVTSWCMALICFCIGCIFIGMTRMSGILFVACMDTFHVDRQMASLPFIIMFFIQSPMSPISGICARRFGTKPVMIFGCALASVGAALCFFAKNITSLTLLFGILYGIGYGFSSVLFPLIISQHFEKQRATALGFCVSGSFFGAFVLPIVLDYCLTTYGLSGTFLWISGITMNCLPFAMLLRNPEKEKTGSIADGGKSIAKSSSCRKNNETNQTSMRDIELDSIAHESILKDITDEVILISKDNPRHEHVDANGLENPAFNSNEEFKNNCSVTSLTDSVTETNLFADKNSSSDSEAIATEFSNCDKENRKIFKTNAINTPSSCVIEKENFNTFKNIKISRNRLEESVMRNDAELPREEKKSNDRSKNKLLRNFLKICVDPVFVAVAVVFGTYGWSFMVVVTIIVDFARDMGIPFHIGKYVLTCYFLTCNVGILSFGWVTDKGYMSLTNFASLLLLFRCVFVFLIPFTGGFAMLMTVAGLQGLAEVSVINLLPLILAERFTGDLKDIAVPSIFLLCGIFDISTPPILGFFRDELGSYVLLFYLMSFMTLICSIIIFFIPWMARGTFCQKQQQKETVSSPNALSKQTLNNET